MVQEQMYVPGGRKGHPDVIYYRNKRGWITWGDTQASKQINMMQKGSQPMPQYGNITHSADLWGPILRGGGAHEFPVEQVLTYRWYRKEMLPDLRPIVMQGRNEVRTGTQPVVNFPQLKGVKITEFPCPEGCVITATNGKMIDKAYHNPIHLGSHLRVMHGYDRSEILKYGEAMGIDFSKVVGGKELVKYEFEEAAEEVQKDAEEVEFELTQVTPQAPATEEIVAEFAAVRNDCTACGWKNEKNTEQGLEIHKRRWCKAVAVA